MAMAKPSDHPGFSTLQKEWYKKLKETGFDDVEQANDRPFIKSGTVVRFEKMGADFIEIQFQYFDRIAHHISRAAFEDEQERQILTLYAEGFTQREIKERLGISGHRCRVYRPIYKWLTLWGMK